MTIDQLLLIEVFVPSQDIACSRICVLHMRGMDFASVLTIVFWNCSSVSLFITMRLLF